MKEEEAYQFFADIIFEKTGIEYKEKDFYRLESRVKNLCSELEVNGIFELVDYFKNNNSQNLTNKLIHISTNNETYFFRDNKPFQAFADIISKKLKEKPSQKINAWSCACSKGQEPYSLVMALMEVFPNLTPSQLSIYATDIHPDVIEYAKKGTYTHLESTRGLNEEIKKKYFSGSEAQGWTINNTVRSFVKFGEFNLFSDVFPSQTYDVIFCRNVLIYQNQENKKQILSYLFKSLKTDGLLFMGSGESLVGTDLIYPQGVNNGAHFFMKSQKEKAA